MKQSIGFIEIAHTFSNLVKKMFGTTMPTSSPHLTYTDKGRYGYIFYNEGSIQIPFYYEFGGGDCQLCIDIPHENNWEKETKTPLSRRDEILHFVGKMVLRDKYSVGRRYEIDKNGINIY